ncbi:MAG TPA: helix-turn-helix domain-containing protein [Gammaproteobacteria bacterium]|nr:helix-turn-helix domain-containing protein [Gammaproteobacteria bacterium]
METLNIREITAHYRALDAKVPLRPIRNRKDYARATSAMNALLDAGAADESHPLAGLAATVGELIGDYDARHFPLPEVSGRAMLRFLMRQHGLTQSELPEIGSQGVVSEILSGKRELNLRQVRALARRFGVAADAFL